MPANDTFDVTKIFSNPQFVDSLVNKYNKDNPAHTMSDADRKMIEADPKLADAIFNAGLVDLIAARATTVEELKGKPPELVSFLRHTETRNLVKDNVVTVEELAKIAPEKLKGAEEALLGGNALKSARILGFNNDRADVFLKSVEKTYKQLLEMLPPLPQTPVPPPSPRVYDPFKPLIQKT